jgi:membrane-associated phospholipid phosphatase
MNRIVALLLFAVLSFPAAAQSEENSSPYKIRRGRDWLIAGAGIAGCAGGLYLINQKERPTPEEVLALDKNDIPKIDRWAAGNNDERFAQISDYFFYGSFATPLLLLLDKDIKAHPEVYLMYVETMAIKGTLFTFNNGLIDRYRPLVYDETATMDQRTSRTNRNSFYAGHTAAAAAATMFTAKVFHDFNPDSKLRPWVWVGAAAWPAVVGYSRLEAGKHFLTDNVVGYAVGTLTGILIPEFHRIKGKSRMSIVPVYDEYKGVVMTYRF